MAKSKSSRITFINIIALLGLALLGFFTFIGAMFFSAGTLGTSIVTALAAIIITALILRGAIYCKGVEANFSKWKKLEITTVVLFWIFAILPGRYVVHAFEIMGGKEELQTAAGNDVEAVNGLFTDYETFESNAIATTRAGLENAVGQPCDEATQAYITKAALNSDENIRSWIDTQRAMLLGRKGTDGFSYSKYRQNVDSIMTRWLNCIQSWDMLYIATHSGDIEALAPKIAEDISTNSARAKLPVIELTDNGVYAMCQHNQTIIMQAPALSFEKAIGNFSGSGILYYIIYIVIMLMVFLDYIIAYRSDKLDVKKVNQGPGGNVL